MKAEIRFNGATQIRVTGERPIEIQAIYEILDAVGKGESIKLSQGETAETLVVTLEHLR